MAFWLSHLQPRSTGGKLEFGHVWGECPRPDWLLGIARTCRVSPAKYAAAERAAKAAVVAGETRRALLQSTRGPTIPTTVAPLSDAANAVRAVLGLCDMGDAIDAFDSVRVAI
jgi:hypothetical protein